MFSTPQTLAHSRLPEPAADELAHAARLAAAIRGEIAAAGGSIEFHRFMALALYAPGLGYYSAGKSKFGAQGDFVTAPELGSLYARSMARAFAPVLAAVEQPAVLELGGGSGAFAVDALQALAALDRLPQRYWILEPSADLRERQRARIGASLDAGTAARVAWLEALPEQAWNGVLFANEVIDALPVCRFVKRAGEVSELRVALDDAGQFIWREAPADSLVGGAVRHLERRLGLELPDGYCSEVLPQLPAWIDAVTGALQSGVAVFVDYGYPRREYYLPDRSDGTLVCHYRHRAHGDPLRLAGLQDITAFVDFTWLAESAVHAGLSLDCYASQAEFLLACGMQEELAAAASLDDIPRLAVSAQAKRLMLPGEMGERFKVIAFSTGLDADVLNPSVLPWLSANRSGRL